MNLIKKALKELNLQRNSAFGHNTGDLTEDFLRRARVPYYIEMAELKIPLTIEALKLYRKKRSKIRKMGIKDRKSYTAKTFQKFE